MPPCPKDLHNGAGLMGQSAGLIAAPAPELWRCWFANANLVGSPSGAPQKAPLPLLELSRYDLSGTATYLGEAATITARRPPDDTITLLLFKRLPHGPRWLIADPANQNSESDGGATPGQSASGM